MSFIYIINLLPLSTAVNKVNEIPITQGVENSFLDFISGFLLGMSFIFILIGLSENIDLD